MSVHQSSLAIVDGLREHKSGFNDSKSLPHIMFNTHLHFAAICKIDVGGKLQLYLCVWGGGGGGGRGEGGFPQWIEPW